MKQCFDMEDISLDAELRAMQDIATILHRLDQPTRTRVLHWIADRFQADAAVAANRTQAANGATPSAEADDSLSVAMLGNLFESGWSATTTPSDQPRTETARGMAAKDLSEFLDRADAGIASKNRPAVKSESGPAWPILPKPILT